MNRQFKIIGLAGTNGSGKDTVGQILADKHDYLFVSVTELLREEAKRRNQPVEREVLRTISAEWRRESGLGVLVDKAVAEFTQRSGQYRGVVMASLRNPGEADRIHELGGTMIWVDADPQIRYERVQANAASRGRAGEDQKSFEQFLVEEQVEMSQSGDVATLNMAGVKAKCDVFLDNNDASLDQLAAQIAKLLAKYKS